MRESEDEDFEYKVDTTPIDYIVNWYVTRDLVCVPMIEYSSLVSYFLVGYGFGIIFFFLPDTLGRKGSMNIFVPLFTINAYLSTYSYSLILFKIGFFLNGFLHLKSTLCYTHGIELVPDKYKAMVPTLINAYDVSTFVVLALFYKFIEPDTDRILNI